MTLTKQTIVDKIEVLENGIIQVRTAVQIVEDGTVLSSSFSRHVLTPGSDLSNQDARVVTIANGIWTPEVVSAYQNSIKDKVL